MIQPMSVLSWIVLGLVAGFIGSKIVNRRGEGILGASGVSGLNLYSLVVAVIGSVALLVLYHAVIRRRSWYGA